jgi:hypothetical protein
MELTRDVLYIVDHPNVLEKEVAPYSFEGGQ